MKKASLADAFFMPVILLFASAAWSNREVFWLRFRVQLYCWLHPIGYSPLD